MLAPDARITINTDVVSDARAEHFWDGSKVASAWFAKDMDGYEGFSWDVYYLYDAAATWDTVPEPLISSGATVIGERDALQVAIVPLLSE